MKERSEAYLKYQRYIRSKDFKEIRKQVLERDNYTCQCCNFSPLKEENSKRTLSCHHKTYDHLYNEGEHLDDLITLCNVCHKAIHGAVSNFQRFKNKPK